MDLQARSVQKKTNSIQEIYDAKKRINLNDASMFYLFSGEDPIMFGKASQEAKWKRAMKEEINVINKNNTWDLKQEPRAWNSRIDGYLTQNDFVRCPYKHVLYVKKNLQDNVMFICLYINGLIFTGDDSIMFEEFKYVMVKEFKTID